MLNKATVSNSMLSIQGELNSSQVKRLEKVKQMWDFYEGFHWEGLPDMGEKELTVNYCRAFVDKFVAFELGQAFSFSTSPLLEKITVTNDGRTLFEYLEDVWEDNNQYMFITEIGQMKSITGEAWVQCSFITPEELKEEDIFNEYPDGRLRLILHPTSVVFPEYNPHDRSKVDKLTVLYSYEGEVPSLLGSKKQTFMFKQVWTNEEVYTMMDGKEEIVPNKYKTIPFIQFKNLVVAGKNEGRSDLEDLVPMNTEYNRKVSNLSEIIDYHASPTTVVFGAKIGNLEKGVNKMWGGLPKDAKVENLELRSDLQASLNYLKNVKTSMCEIGGIPESVLGSTQAISNTSGVALQYLNLPLIDKNRLKVANTEDALERLNTLIIYMSLLEGLVRKPENVKPRDMFWNEVTILDTLPKDTLLELQQIQQEMKLGLELRRNAMLRIGRENVDSLIEEIDKDMQDNPSLYGYNMGKAKIGANGLIREGDGINSGFTNGETPIEKVRKEITGSNGMSNY